MNKTQFWARARLGISVVILALIVFIGSGGVVLAQPAASTEAPYIQLVDAQAFGPTINGGISVSPTAAVPSSFNRYGGTWADGVSVLVVRLISQKPTSGPVTFSLSPDFLSGQPAAMDRLGSLWTAFPNLPAPANGKPGSLTATVPGGAMPVVFFRPPTSFLSDYFAESYPVDLTVSVAGAEVADVSFKIVRPPVILVHGLLSSPATWKSSPVNMVDALTANDGLLVVNEVDYSGENTSGINEISGNLPMDLANVVLAARGQYVAATRADVVGHSLGSVIADWYTHDLSSVAITRGDGFQNGAWSGTNDQYLRADDFGLGDIRRLVTIGGPLNGSPVADQVVLQMTAGEITEIANLVGGTGDGEAIYDLQTTSSATKILEQGTPQVNWLPVVCTAGTATLGGTLENLIIEAAVLYELNVQLPPPNSSDLIVTVSSQENQLGSTPAGTSQAVVGVAHTGEASNAGVEGVLLKALDLDDPHIPPEGTFGGYPLFNPGL